MGDEGLLAWPGPIGHEGETRDRDRALCPTLALRTPRRQIGLAWRRILSPLGLSLGRGRVTQADRRWNAGGLRARIGRMSGMGADVAKRKATALARVLEQAGPAWVREARKVRPKVST